MKYLLDRNKLRQGDIILESGETKLVSNLIKKVTNSEFSHAMIYIDHTLIHAINDGGVFSKNPQRILRSKENSFKVLRLKTPVSNLVLEQICDNARVKVGSVYSMLEASKTILPKKKKKEEKNNEQFCSRLVAQCYYEAGIQIVDDVNLCTPEDINKSEVLQEVLGCVKKASAEDIKMDSKTDPNIENQKETLKWLEQTRQLLKKDGINIQTINDISMHLSSDSSADKRICKYIESTKYLKLYNVDRQINPYRYNDKEFELALENSQDKINLLKDEIDLNRRDIVRHGKNLKAVRENYRNTKLKFCKLHIQLYRNLLKECEARLNIILKYKQLDIYTESVVHNLLSETSSLLR
ncbi:hypothetical protein HWA77_25175 [Photobacterium damselae subsp. damselae]|uniref:Uncharacterized protein n=1 Tax=Photobacterium damselae subsp. damselae TaxID=85581 RepID=A0A850QXX0_PHODD|nr:hypothetical protein [Photobacterium damselae subsp. damselae]